MHADGPGRLVGWAALLHAASFFYGLGVKLRSGCYQHRVFASRRLPCRVISIGNLTVGGSAKTPMTIYMARLLRQMGYKVVILSRGYQGKAEKYGGVVSDGERLCMDVKTAGDEPFMMAGVLKNIPVVVGRDRFRAGRAAVAQFQPDIIILDDAFQHLGLARDLNFVLIDMVQGFGNGYLLPRGPLREPPAALGRADAFILVQPSGRPLNKTSVFAYNLEKRLPKRPVFQAQRIPFIRMLVRAHTKATTNNARQAISADPRELADKGVYAFSGIANNAGFRKTLIQTGCRLCGFSEFYDHHWYSAAEIEAIFNAAQNLGAEAVVSTEKDFMRIENKGDFRLDLIIMGLDLAVQGEKAFEDFIDRQMQTDYARGADNRGGA